MGSTCWTYDGEGNPTSIAEGATAITRTFDNLGRVLTCTDTLGQTVAYTYDPYGLPPGVGQIKTTPPRAGLALDRVDDYAAEMISPAGKRSASFAVISAGISFNETGRPEDRIDATPRKRRSKSISRIRPFRVTSSLSVISL